MALKVDKKAGEVKTPAEGAAPAEKQYIAVLEVGKDYRCFGKVFLKGKGLLVSREEWLHLKQQRSSELGPKMFRLGDDDDVVPEAATKAKAEELEEAAAPAVDLDDTAAGVTV